MKYAFVDNGILSKLACLKQSVKALSFFGELK